MVEIYIGPITATISLSTNVDEKSNIVQTGPDFAIFSSSLSKEVMNKINANIQIAIKECQEIVYQAAVYFGPADELVAKQKD